LFLVAAAGALRAQAPAAAPPPLRLEAEAIEGFVAEQLAAKGLVGLSLAVIRNGTPVLVKGFGKASLADDSPVTPQTRFAIGSITKQFTSAAVLLLAEDGKLSPGDRVAKWYPDLTRANDITLRDLMNHVSGTAASDPRRGWVGCRCRRALVDAGRPR
jgi:CubicO group peptidase (beta-lactamase class C family)